MNPQHIDFISAYCDRWCERCPMTDRCSAFTVTTAIAMCGDESAALELVFGRAPDDDGVTPAEPEWLKDLPNIDVSEDEALEWERSRAARRRSVDATPTVQRAEAYMLLARDWLRTHQDLESSSDIVVREAFEVISYDAIFIRVKLHRALDSRDCFAAGKSFVDDHPVQNDWNGSAKVALISVERSTEAWGVLGSAMGERTPLVLADQLRDLRAEAEREFPNAWKFRRPGFDEC
jgi:hypothetical protein